MINGKCQGKTPADNDKPSKKEDEYEYEYGSNEYDNGKYEYGAHNKDNYENDYFYYYVERIEIGYFGESINFSQTISRVRYITSKCIPYHVDLR